ncbi:MAG: ABC transporter permease [Pseudobutyrivibrio sp.]|nr:ABC transporter permease [Pseudobutyrivibrio sp.]
MNIVSKLTLRHLGANKKRTVVTTFGIVASTALMTAILVGLFSFFRFAGDVAEKKDGCWHGYVNNITDQQLEDLQNDDRIGEVGFTDDTKEITGLIVKSDAKPRFKIGNIRHMDATAAKWYVTTEYDGTLPVNSNEVAVEEEFLKDNNLNLSIGDKLEFEEGSRYLENSDGGKDVFAGVYVSNEKFAKVSDETCVITAILHGNQATSNWDVIRGLDSNFKSDKRVAIFTLKELDIHSITTIRDIMADCGITDYGRNNEYLAGNLCIEGWGNNAGPILKIIGTMIGIVMVASIVLIYNAFSMSLTERIKYLGMLASVGATRRQKRLSVYFEGLILGIVGIPLGIAAGILGSYATLDIVGGMLIESDIFSGTEAMTGGIPLRAPILLLVVVAILSAITIAISAIKPAHMASKIMPIDALRETNTVKVKAKKLKVSKLVRKIFGYEGELAYKNIKRNGKKGKVIIATITISIVTFLSIDYFDTIFEKSNIYSDDISYQVSVTAAYSDKDRLREDIENTKGVDGFYSYESVLYYFEKEAWMGDNWECPNREILNPDFLADDYKALEGKVRRIALVIIDDKMFTEYIEQNGLSKEDYFGEQLNGVIVNNLYHDEKTEGLFNNKILGQKLCYDNPENNPPAVTITGLVKYDKNSTVSNLCPNETISIVVPSSMYYERMSKIVDPDELTYTYAIMCKNPEKMEKTFYDMLERGEYKAYSCYNITKLAQGIRTLSTALKTAVYGFSSLLTLIVIANIVNTISTGVLLRRKEFAMYRSVGMTDGGFKKMLVLETILYGLKALGLGLPISVLISFLMHRTMTNLVMPFMLNWTSYILVIIVVFAVVSLSMLLSSAKVKKDNIIETLKDDIC